jgi:hypothetical protein
MNDTPDGITHGLSFQGNSVNMYSYRKESRDVKGNLSAEYSQGESSGTSGDSSDVYLYFAKQEIGFADFFSMTANLHDIG